MNTIASNYFDLVVKTVRGSSPIPEYSGLRTDRTHLAQKHIASLNEKFGDESSGHELIDLARSMGPGFLAMTWEKMSPSALTMCGDKNLNQLIECLKSIEAEKIPGDLIEAGVWRGGLPLIMRAFLQSVGNRERTVWLADSFKGLPEESTDPQDIAAHMLLEPLMHLQATREQVEQGFDYFGLKDSQVKFLEGWFKDTLIDMPAEKFAIIRLDGDYYESTRDSLTALYPKLSSGGYLIVDDYNLPLGCKRAVDEYRLEHNISEEIIEINSQSIFWRKK